MRGLGGETTVLNGAVIKKGVPGNLAGERLHFLFAVLTMLLKVHGDIGRYAHNSDRKSHQGYGIGHHIQPDGGGNQL